MIGMEWERRKKDGRNQESRDYNETLKNGQSQEEIQQSIA